MHNNKAFHFRQHCKYDSPCNCLVNLTHRSYHILSTAYRWAFYRVLQWRHNEFDGVSNHQPRDCLFNRLFIRTSKKTSKIRVAGGNSPVTREFPAQKASNPECSHDDVIKWKHFPLYWPFMWGIHRSPVNSLHKGQWRGASMFSLNCAVNKRLSKQWWGWWFETPSRSL